MEKVGGGGPLLPSENWAFSLVVEELCLSWVFRVRGSRFQEKLSRPCEGL